MTLKYLALALICIGCGAGLMCAPASPPLESRDSDLVCSVVGGIMGMKHTVRITPDGQVLVSDGWQGPELLLGVLSAEQDEELNALLGNWQTLPEVVDYPGTIADDLGTVITFSDRTLSSGSFDIAPHRFSEIAHLVFTIEEGFGTTDG